MTTTEMLRKSKLDIYGLGCHHDKFIECVERFAEMVRADEREIIFEKNKTVIEQINKQMQELREAVLAENEACALIADEAEPYSAADLIRKRVKA